MTTPPTINWANRISSDVYIRDCDDPTAQMRAQVFDVNYDKGEAEVGFYPERGVKFSMIHLPEIYRATIPLADLSLDPLSGAAEFGYADIIRRGDKTVDLSYMDWTGQMHTPVIKTDDDGQPADAARAELARGGFPEGEEALPEFIPGVSSTAPIGESVGIQRAGGTAPLFTREEVHRKAMQVIDWMKDELRKLEDMIKSME